MSNFEKIIRQPLSMIRCLTLALLLFLGLQLSASAESSTRQATAAQSSTSVDSQPPPSQSINTTPGGAITSDGIISLPSLNAPIIDQANILSAAEKQQLSQQIFKLYQEGKAQIGIVIVPTTGQESIFDFAMRIGDQWKLGSSKTDNGLVIAVAVDDRRVHIATGYGLEGVLPDIVVGQIIRNQITPAFKQGLYAQGIQQGFDEIERILNLDPQIAQQAAFALEQRQQAAAEEQAAKDKIMGTSLVILVIGTLASMVVGKKVSAATSAVTGFAAGMIYGSGLLVSLLIGFGLFVLIVTPLAQLILQAVLSGRGGGGGQGGRGGGGYGGGGGRFGGGGASGSW